MDFCSTPASCVLRLDPALHGALASNSDHPFRNDATSSTAVFAVSHNNEDSFSRINRVIPAGRINITTSH